MPSKPAAWTTPTSSIRRAGPRRGGLSLPGPPPLLTFLLLLLLALGTVIPGLESIVGNFLADSSRPPPPPPALRTASEDNPDFLASFCFFFSDLLFEEEDDDDLLGVLLPVLLRFEDLAGVPFDTGVVAFDDLELGLAGVDAAATTVVESGDDFSCSLPREPSIGEGAISLGDGTGSTNACAAV